jgi:hypothetical protein
MTLIATILGLPHKWKDKPKMSSPAGYQFLGERGPHFAFSKTWR